MNENNNEFHDELDDVIARATKKFGLNNDEPIDDAVTPAVPETPIVNEEVPTTPTVNYVDNDLLDMDLDDDDDDLRIDDPDDDPYGIRDFDHEMEEEDRQRELIRQQQLQEAKNRQDEMNDGMRALPPQSLDKNFQKEAIDFQTDNLSIVTGMVERVKAKYHLKGGIKNDRLRMVMGDLLEEYYNNGEEITPRFEKIIMDNWTHAGDNGEEYSNTDAPSTQNAAVNNTTAERLEDVQPVEVNIDVTPDQPVTVNIDDEIVNAINKKRVVNINVRELTSKDMEKVTVIENSPREGIIRSFDTGLGYTPLTLPLSAYRCMIKPMNFFDMISMNAPDNNSPVDYHLKRWRTIYDHLKNPSIGEFKDFEDFLKKTKYNDMTLLEWGLLTATSDDEETLTLECGNPKCKQEFIHRYTPRTLIHPKPDKLPPEYDEISKTGGDRAIQLHDQIASKRTRYRLPNSKVVIEIWEPSAYEYLTIKLPLIMSRYQERFPNDPNMEMMQDENRRNSDPRMMEFSIMMSMMMRIPAIIVPPPDEDDYNTPHEYRFTNWDDIEEQLGMLPMEDTLAIFKLISEQDDSAPIDFYVSDIQCPHCGRKEPRGLPVTNLVQNLIFRVSRRLQNTEINLTRLD